MQFKDIEETEEFVDGKKIYKGVYDNNSDNKKKRRIVSIDCHLCGEPTFASIGNYKKKMKNFCSKSCSSTYAAKSRKTYPEPKGKISYVKELKEESKCVRCGESHPACLDFHHIEPEQKIESVSRMKNKAGYELKDVKKEIEKCEIICKNCHAKEHSARSEQ